MVAYNLQALYAKCEDDVEAAKPAVVQAKAVKKCRSVREIDTVITAQVRPAVHVC